MATHDRDTPSVAIDTEDHDTLGIINALERTCEMESKLRSAIQQTHPLTTTLDWDFTVADKEREALLAISEQLEYLEDKLREARFLGQNIGEQRAVVLSQLDAQRRELLEVVELHLPRVVFGKEVVREILLFASLGDDTPRTSGLHSEVSRLGLLADPKSNRKSVAGAPTLAGLVHTPRWRRPGGSGAPSPPSPLSPSPPMDPSRASTPYGRPYNNELWEGPKPGRDAAATAQDALRSSVQTDASAATTIAAGSLTQSTNGLRRSLMGGGGRSRRYGAAAYSSPLTVTDEDIYGPPAQSRSAGPAPRPVPTRTAAAAAVAAGPAAADSPRRFGGVLKIRDMLARAEEGLTKVAEAQEQRRSPAPPRITGDLSMSNLSGRGEDWEGSLPPPSMHGGSYAGDEDGNELGSVWGPALTERTDAAPAAPSVRDGISIRDWQIRAEPSVRGEPHPGSPHVEEAEQGGGLPGLVSKLAGLAFVLGSVAAATMAATGKLGGGGGGGAGQVNSHRRKASSTATPATPAAGGGPRPGAVSGTDLPPWTAAEVAARASAARRRKGSPSSTTTTAPGGRATASAGRMRRSRGEAPVQAPVMHVRQPPSSGSFPVTPPPDVSAAMG